jgi:long-chain acyl-CoA synthetase
MVETRQDKEAATFPRLLLAHARQRPERAAFREKDLGIWQTTTWRQVADEVRALPAAWPRWASSAA